MNRGTSIYFGKSVKMQILPPSLHMTSDRDDPKINFVHLEEMHNFHVGEFHILRHLECITHLCT